MFCFPCYIRMLVLGVWVGVVFFGSLICTRQKASKREEDPHRLGVDFTWISKMVSLMKFMFGKMVLLVRAITTCFAHAFFISLITFIVLLVAAAAAVFIVCYCCCDIFLSLISFGKSWSPRETVSLSHLSRRFLNTIVMAAKLIKHT